MLYCLGMAIGAPICEKIELNVRQEEMSCKKATLVYEVWVIHGRQ